MTWIVYGLRPEPREIAIRLLERGPSPMHASRMRRCKAASSGASAARSPRVPRLRPSRDAAISLIPNAPPFGLATLKAEQRRLTERLQHFGDCRDAPEIWRKAGLAQPEQIAEITDEAFLAIQRPKGAGHDAR